MAQRVISELFGQYTGKPILVIGGGPSVAADLPKLDGVKPALVLSANEHGCMQDRFPVDYIVHCDKVHCLKREPENENKPINMTRYLRQFGKPLISRWSTADVRLEDWRFNGNSGLTATAVAAALGGSPIVATGLDFWSTGRHYFYDALAGLTPKARRFARQPVIMQPDKRLGELRRFAEEAHIRPVSGLLLTAWPAYDPAERLGPPPMISYTARPHMSAQYRAVRSFHWSNHDTVAAKTVLKLTKAEAAPLLRNGSIAAVDSPA